MKIIYLIAGTYRPAGMERVLVGKANWLAAHGYDVLIVTTEQRGREPAFQFAPQIRHIDLDVNYETNNGHGFASKLFGYPLRQLRHRRRLSALLKQEKADVVVGMFCNEQGFLPRIKDGSSKVLEYHFSRFKRLQYDRKGIWRFADEYLTHTDLCTVRRFDAFVVLTDEDRGYWEKDAQAAGFALDNIHVISNPRPFVCGQPAPLDGKLVIAVGRYCHQKGFERILEAWKTVKSDASAEGWKLWIVGDGEDRAKLQALIDELGLEGSVRLGRAEEDMKEVYAQASVLAMSSRYEGLPMVLIESQSAGVPAVSFACKCGPSDVITDGVDGFLVPEGDVEALSDRLLQLMRDDQLRKKMGAAAFEAASRYDEETIMQKWVKLFAEL